MIVDQGLTQEDNIEDFRNLIIKEKIRSDRMFLYFILGTILVIVVIRFIVRLA